MIRQIGKDVKKIIEDVGIDTTGLKLSTSLCSLNIKNIAKFKLELENKFDIEIEDSESLEWKTVSDIVDCIMHKTMTVLKLGEVLTSRVHITKSLTTSCQGELLKIGHVICFLEYGRTKPTEAFSFYSVVSAKKIDKVYYYKLDKLKTKN